MKVTVSGPPGSGKSSVCQSLCERFGLERISAGEAFRALAEHRGVSLAELGALAEHDSTIDRELDLRLAELAATEENVLVEGRIAAFVVKDADLRVYLTASPQVRAGRVAQRECIAVDEAIRLNAEREASERRRYREFYGIDPDDFSAYDLLVNTERWDAKGVAEVVAAGIQALGRE